MGTFYIFVPGPAIEKNEAGPKIEPKPKKKNNAPRPLSYRESYLRHCEKITRDNERWGRAKRARAASKAAHAAFLEVPGAPYPFRRPRKEFVVTFGGREYRARWFKHPRRKRTEQQVWVGGKWCPLERMMMPGPVLRSAGR